MTCPIDIHDPAWQALYEAASAAPNESGWTPFHHPALIAAVAAAHGLTPLTLGTFGDERLNAALCVLTPEAGTPWPISACPFNGPLIRPTGARYSARRDKFTSQHLLQLLQALIERKRWAHVRIPAGQFDPREVIACGFRITPSFTYEIPISSDSELMEQVLPDRRRQIRGAAGSGVTVREIPLDSATKARHWGPIIHALHAEQSGRHALAADTDADGFVTLLTHGIGQSWLRLFVAESASGIPCAFQITTVQNASAANVLTGYTHSAPPGANALLRMDVLAELAREGVQRFDLNGARPGEGGRFKASLGGRLVERWNIAPPPPPAERASLGMRLRRRWWSLQR